MTKEVVTRIALTVFLVFHLYCVILAPNSLTYLGQRSAWFVNPYVSFLEMSSQWGFFAPDPGPPPVFIEYEAMGTNGEPLASGFWPEKVSPYFLRERQNRRIGVARFLIATDERIEKAMGPYYCRQFAAAQSVRLWKVVQGMANLHEVASGKRTIEDGKGTDRKWVTQYLCPGRS